MPDRWSQCGAWMRKADAFMLNLNDSHLELVLWGPVNWQVGCATYVASRVGNRVVRRR
jgi:hypothetical protein